MLLAEGVCRFQTAIKYNLKVDKMRHAGLCPVKPEDTPLKEPANQQPSEIKQYSVSRCPLVCYTCDMEHHKKTRQRI